MYLDTGIPFISAKNIVNGNIDWTDIKHISVQEYLEIQRRCNVAVGDILLTKSGSLGNCALVQDVRKVGLFESLAIIKYRRDVLNGRFLCEQIRSPLVQRQFTAGTKGVAVKHLHLNIIGNTKIIVPPLPLQNEFAAFIEHLDKSKVELQKNIARMDAMIKSLLNEAIGG